MSESNKQIHTAPDAKRRIDGSTAFRIALCVLALLLLASTVLLSIRLYQYAKQDNRAVSLKTGMDAELDIFSVSYQGSTGELMVIGSNGDKVVAPGTDVEYTLRLRNTDSVALDYELLPEVTFHSEHELPILVRVLDENDAYLVGDAKTWVSASELESMSDTGTLRSGEAIEYLFQWRWPFESGDDEYDTFLGDHTFGENVDISVSFSVHATANTDIDINGGAYQSGLLDSIAIAILVVLLIVTLVLLIVSRVRSRRSTQPTSDHAITETIDEKQN